MGRKKKQKIKGTRISGKELMLILLASGMVIYGVFGLLYSWVTYPALLRERSEIAEFEIRSGEKLARSLDLDAEANILIVANGTVRAYLDGQLIEEGDKMSLKVSAGEHDLTISSANEGTAIGRMAIVRGVPWIIYAFSLGVIAVGSAELVVLLYRIRRRGGLTTKRRS